MGNPKKLILIGFILVLIGAVVPWLVILEFLPSTFLINFLTYGASVSGLILGIIGAAMWGGAKRKGE